MEYDYVIIGGGPSGIFCSDKLSLLGYKVCLIESLETLGGCHRVRYVEDNNGNKIHTEHGPRVYLGSYLDFWEWIKTIGVERDKNFKKYKFDIFSKDFRDFSNKFTFSEIISIIVVYIIHCIFKVKYSSNYTLEDFSDNYDYTDFGKDKLNRLSRLIDGGNLNKSLLNAFLDGIDSGIVYNIYEPSQPMDTLIWNKFKNKLIKQKVNILLNTYVSEINIGNIITNKGIIKTNNTILCIPPYAINKIKNAPYYSGYNPIEFNNLSKYQMYEPYVCATISFKKYGNVSWGISDEHPWGLIAIDMGSYFNNVDGSMYIVSVTHPEKLDHKTKKTANEMNKDEFLERIVELVKKRFGLNEEPIYKTFSPNVKKVNNEWIESDRAFLYSPPGWLKPNFNISKKYKVFTTGHHLGNSYHDYNSMESAIQNSSVLLKQIVPEYNYSITSPWKLSNIIWIIILTLILFIIIFIYRRKIINILY
tara:strand:- start:1523 stop:2947 length:1425 start_codon:yes stop_codon:yes gene_type:complete